MPKIIDHEERAERIADAAMRVVGRDGIGSLSVRAVADEAGLAVASLRRAFPTQASLRVFCMELISSRAQERIDALDSRLTAFEFAIACLSELLPLDDERRMEMAAFLALGGLAAHDPLLRAEYDRVHALIAAACASVLAGITGQYELESDGEPAPARELHALLDGLALHLLRQAPGLDTSWAVNLLADYLHRTALGTHATQGVHDGQR